MSTLLSICIPTFNRAVELAAALDSILLQVADDDRVEVLVSDNASPDSTPDVVRGYQARHPRIRYQRNAENRGFDGNVEACIRGARGDYLAFFADDDLASPGMFSAVLQALEEHRPAILYLNHYPLIYGDHQVRRALKHPQRDLVFSDGRQFLLFAGLGFISALTVKSDYAMEYLDRIKHGVGQAHLDVAARIALLKPGPFVFLGTQAVAAGVPAKPAYDSVTYAALSEARFYYSLEDEGLLDSAAVRRRVGGSIFHNLARAVLAKKCSPDYRALEEQIPVLAQTYGRYPQYYVFVCPLLLMPRVLLIGPYRLGRALNRWRSAGRQRP